MIQRQVQGSVHLILGQGLNSINFNYTGTGRVRGMSNQQQRLKVPILTLWSYVLYEYSSVIATVSACTEEGI